MTACFKSQISSRRVPFIARVAPVALLLSLASQAYAAPPVAVDDARTIPTNSSITLNLIANDSDPDGDPISLIDVAQPQNGAISVNADGSVFYRPQAGFSGIDTFTYTIQEEGTEELLTATATVSVTVQGSEFRPYSETDNTITLAEALTGACESLRSRSDAELGDNGRALLNRCLELEEMAAANPDAVEGALSRIAPEEAMTQMQVSSNASRSQTFAVSQRISQLRGFAGSGLTVNGIAFKPSGEHLTGGGASADDDYSGLLSRLGVFASFQFENTERDQTLLENGYESDSNALTIGMDYFLNDRWIVGTAFGYTQNDLKYVNDGGGLDTEIGSLILFGSYMRNRFTLDVQAGYAGLAFDSDRHVNYEVGPINIDRTIESSTEGEQLLFNSQLQWEWSRGPLTLYPFGRFDYLESDIKGFGETGSGGLQMILGDQHVKQSTFSTGVQATYAVNSKWGVLVPMLKVTLYNEMDSERDALFARFAYDPDASNTFIMSGNESDKTYYQLGVGTSAVFKGGLSAFFEYQQLLGYENLSSYQVQAGLRYEL